MPTVNADGCLLNVVVEGRDSGPTLMLCNSLGSTLQMWDPQMAALTKLYRVVRYDRRAHGKSSSPPGPYSMKRFGKDAIAILDDLNIEKVHWCGLSLGGMTGQWMGANAPERINKLILANTSCYFPDPTNWDKRIASVEAGGIESVVDMVANVWLTPEFAEHHPDVRNKMKAMMLGCDKEGYLACCRVLRVLDQREFLPKIKAPTLVIAGKHDNSTPVPASEYIRKYIPGASMTLLDAAHISNMELPHDFTEAVVGFLSQR